MSELTFEQKMTIAMRIDENVVRRWVHGEKGELVASCCTDERFKWYRLDYAEKHGYFGSEDDNKTLWLGLGLTFGLPILLVGFFVLLGILG